MLKLKEINKTKLALNNDQFYPTVNKKTQIFLHHTAGLTAKGAADWWNQTPEHVGTAFIVDRDGTIYQTFDPAKWGYHLGVKGDDDTIEKDSIGIEIVSGGHLVKTDKGYMFCPLYPKLIGAKPIPDGDVVVLDNPWRGEKFFHKYTDAQVESVLFLVQYLKHEFGIEIQKDLSNFWEFNPEVIKNHTPGLYSHTTVREDKDDIYPDERLTKALIDYFGVKSEIKDEPAIEPEPIDEPKPSRKGGRR